MTRILQATPPESTLEGQIQRRLRDREDDDYEVVWSGSQKRVGLTGTWDSREKTGTI